MKSGHDLSVAELRRRSSSSSGDDSLNLDASGTIDTLSVPTAARFLLNDDTADVTSNLTPVIVQVTDRHAHYSGGGPPLNL